MPRAAAAASKVLFVVLQFSCPYLSLFVVLSIARSMLLYCLVFSVIFITRSMLLYCLVFSVTCSPGGARHLFLLYFFSYLYTTIFFCVSISWFFSAHVNFSICTCVCVRSHHTVLSTRRHPAHPVSMQILHPIKRGTSSVVTKLRHGQLFYTLCQVDSSSTMPCHCCAGLYMTL